MDRGAANERISPDPPSAGARSRIPLRLPPARGARARPHRSDADGPQGRRAPLRAPLARRSRPSCARSERWILRKVAEWSARRGPRACVERGRSACRCFGEIVALARGARGPGRAAEGGSAACDRSEIDPARVVALVQARGARGAARRARRTSPRCAGSRAPRVALSSARTLGQLQQAGARCGSPGAW